jgi:hypothetical protein
MNNETEIIKLNPKEYLIKALKQFNNIEIDFDIPWIKFDKNIEPEYKIIRSCSHDGTMMFTFELIAKVIEPLFKMQSYYIPTKPKNNSKIKEIHYIVGELELKSEFGMVDLPIGRYPGQTDIVTIPVKCEYIYY